MGARVGATLPHSLCQIAVERSALYAKDEQVRKEDEEEFDEAAAEALLEEGDDGDDGAEAEAEGVAEEGEDGAKAEDGAEAEAAEDQAGTESPPEQPQQAIDGSGDQDSATLPEAATAGSQPLVCRL